MKFKSIKELFELVGFCRYCGCSPKSQWAKNDCRRVSGHQYAIMMDDLIHTIGEEEINTQRGNKND